MLPHPLGQLRDEPAGDEMTILVEKDAAGNTRIQAGIQLFDLHRRHLLGVHALVAHQLNIGHFLFQMGHLFEEKDHTPLLQVEIHTVELGELVEKVQAGKIQIAQQWNGTQHLAPVAAAPEAPQPCHQLAIQSRLDVKGTARVEHPLQGFSYHTGGGERNTMAGDDESCVAEGGSRADLPFLHESYITPGKR